MSSTSTPNNLPKIRNQLNSTPNHLLRNKAYVDSMVAQVLLLLSQDDIRRLIRSAPTNILLASRNFGLFYWHFTAKR